MNTEESNLRTDRTNCTTIGTEEATSRTMGSVETCYRGETDCGCCGGEGILVVEKGERE